MSVFEAATLVWLAILIAMMLRIMQLSDGGRRVIHRRWFAVTVAVASVGTVLITLAKAF